MSDQSGGIGGRYRGLKPMEDAPDTGTATGGDPGDESTSNIEPIRQPPDDDFEKAMRDALAHLGGTLDQIRRDSAAFGQRQNEHESSINQLLGQYQGIENALPQYRQAIATLDARITAVAQALSKNWRHAAVLAAVEARQPAESPTKLMEMARLFAEFIDPPAPPEPPVPLNSAQNDEAERVGELVKRDPETKH